MSIRVIVISDFQLLLESLALLVNSAGDTFTLIRTAPSFDALPWDTNWEKIDVVLLDIDGNTDQTLTTVSKIKSISHAKVLAVTRLSNSQLQDKIILFGGRGVVDRSAGRAQLLSAIEKVHQGQVWLDRVATGRIFVELSRLGNATHTTTTLPEKCKQPLTEREHQIVSCIAEHTGESGKLIAKRMCISESTLRNHLTAIYDKLGVNNRHGLVAYAFRNGLATANGSAA